VSELFGAPLACAYQHAYGRARDLAFAERVPGCGHLLQGPCHTNLGGGRGEGHPEPLGEPRGDRQVPVPAVRTPAVDLGQPAGPLGQQQVGRSLQLAEIGFELLVSCEAKSSAWSSSIEERSVLIRRYYRTRVRFAVTLVTSRASFLEDSTETPAPSPVLSP